MLDFCRVGGYPVYVLCLLLMAYLLNQLDRYILAVVIQPVAQDVGFGDKSCLANLTESHVTEYCNNASNEEECLSLLDTKGIRTCKWDYSGSGWEYQLMAGPVFVLVYTFMGIFVGFLADMANRKVLLSASLILWSFMTCLMGFVTEYWQLVALRFGQGIGEAGCTPFAVSLIADYFPETTRGSAMGFYNWGIYMGYSLAFTVGTYTTRANIMGMGWRGAFLMSGFPGFAVALLVLLSVREPVRKHRTGEEGVPPSRNLCQRLGPLLRPFLSPALLLLCLAGSVRNAGGYVWAYNVQNYFSRYFPQEDVGRWMSWIPLVGGSSGVLVGGFVSDRVVKRRGLTARVWVLVISQILASPFLLGVLLLPPPYAFLMLIPAYIIGEMWVGVTLAILVELVPSSIRTSAVALYLFIITNIGGSAPMLVTPLSALCGLREALILLYPGAYVTGSVLFLLALCVIRRGQPKPDREDLEPLLQEPEPEPGPEQRHMKST